MATKIATLAAPPRRRAAARIRRLRALTGWSQEETAQRAGIGVRTLRDLELGRARMTALELVEFLEDALQDSQYRTGEPTVGGACSVAALIQFDTNVLPAARSCGAKATEQAAAADEAQVVRLTAGNPKRAA